MKNFSCLTVNFYRIQLFLCGIVLSAILTGCVQVPRETLPFSLDPQVSVRGKVLVEGFAACGFCHGNPLNPRAPLSGGRMILTAQGQVRAPNITPSGNGIGSWDMEELLLALRGVQSKDMEKDFYGSVHHSYAWMSNEDGYAILSYLRILDPVQKRVDRDRVENSYLGLGPAGNINNPGFIPSTKAISEVSVGRYLATRVGRCVECHSAVPQETSWYQFSWLFGTTEIERKGQTISFDGREKEAPLLPGRFSKQELMNFFDTGVVRSGSVVDPRFCPTQYFKNAPTEQKQALAAFFALKRNQQ